MDKRGFYASFLSFMVESGALLFGDFTLKSGRKSPYFINTGEYKTGAQFSKLGGFYAELIQGSFTGEMPFDVLFGPAYKGIPLATATSMKLAEAGFDVNVSFDRKERKDHGEGGVILGYTPQNGDRIAIVEDVTSAGTSVRETIALLEELEIGASVVALYISVDRDERGTGELTAIEQLKRELGIDVYAIATAEQIIDYLENTPDYCEPIPDAKLHAENMRKYLAEYGGKTQE